ncbi:MAG TPA: pyridoxal phosphate-dependent aminotransferase [Stellaceae bacterium]|nr:pyridoxal phosphate-dependent aminotransferase [Stellaceae bacterium]
MHIAAKVSNIKPSATVALSAQARALKAEGRDVINLAAGEPDFDTPDHIKVAAIRAIERGDTKYTSVDGTDVLKRAIVEKLRRDNGIECSVRQISVGSGASQIVFSALCASLEPGDQVIVPAPYWPTYLEMVTLAGGAPVIAPCDAKHGFKLQPETLRNCLTERTRWLIINSPNNPTGAVYSAHELRALADVLSGYPDVNVMSDEVYESLNYEAEPCRSFAVAVNGFAHRLFTVNGVSKTYAMTGWRIGFGCGPEDLIVAMAAVQSKCTTNPCSISQAAAVEALVGPQDCVGAMRSAFAARRQLVAGRLNLIEGVECRPLGGGLSVFVDFTGVLGRRIAAGGSVINDDVELASYLLEYANVAIVPGTAFGAPGFVRMALGGSDALLEEACKRIEAACDELLDAAASPPRALAALG